MVFSLVTSSFAATVSEDTEISSNVVIVDDGIYINDTFYTPQEFRTLLDTAIELPTVQPYGAIAGTITAGVGVIEGTWWIPGVGQVLVAAGGVIIVGGAVVAVGSWLYNTITQWFADRAYDKSAEDAINGADANKQNHVLKNKLHDHGWSNIFNGRDPNWNQLAPILIKTLQDGKEKWEKGNQYVRILEYNGWNVVVRFIKAADGTIQYFSTAFLESRG